jgi:hypothetical protein
MYLRTTRRKNRDGAEVVYYPLAHHVRHPESGQTVARGSSIPSGGRINWIGRLSYGCAGLSAESAA